jgi:ParB/RepB/Spo0J family partition protein
LARPDFRATAARRLSEERELSPAIVSLLDPQPSRHSRGVRNIPIDRIEPNPENPRLAFDEGSLEELASSIREHGILQPILVRPLPNNRYQLIAGERRWRASKIADQETVAALVEDIDDETALEIAIIENLQREDLTPLDEAAMYERMVHEHGYSIRKLAEKLGKDKGYLENRLRLAAAPIEVREMVSLRKDTLSHAYELMKVEDPKKRRKLVDQVARGELTLIKLRERIEGRRSRRVADDAPEDGVYTGPEAADAPPPMDDATAWSGRPAATVEAHGDEALVDAKRKFADAVEDLIDVIRDPEVLRAIGQVDRSNLAKYLTIARIRLDNAIAVVRSGDPDRQV